MPAWKTPPYSARPTAGRRGRNSPGCAATARDRNGSPARAACACTRSFWIRANPGRIFIAISAAGAFRTRRRRRNVAADQPRPAFSTFIPDPTAEVGHCVHRIAMHPSRPDVLFMQKHWDVMRSDDARRLLARGQRQPADRFRLPDRRPRARAGNHLRRADQERLGALSARRQAARLSQPHAAATNGNR